MPGCLWPPREGNEMTFYKDTGVATVWPKSLMWAFFDTPNGAQSALRTLRDAGQAALVSLESTAVVEKDAAGSVTLDERDDLGGGQGLSVGLLLGSVLGALFPELSVASSAATMGAAMGLGSRLHDAGFEDAQLRTAAEQMPANSSALFAVATRDWVEYMATHQELDDVMRYLNSVAYTVGSIPVSQQLSDAITGHDSDG
jgi:uncharacterized membrane protein